MVVGFQTVRFIMGSLHICCRSFAGWNCECVYVRYVVCYNSPDVGATLQPPPLVTVSLILHKEIKEEHS